MNKLSLIHSTKINFLTTNIIIYDFSDNIELILFGTFSNENYELDLFQTINLIFIHIIFKRIELLIVLI